MKYIFSLFLSFCTTVAIAQDVSLLDRLYSNVASSCVSVTYAYTSRISGVDASGEGVLTAQGQMWKVVGNGVEMYCDGECVWVLDHALKEAVVEPVSQEEQSELLTNPAAIILRLPDSFDVSVVNPSSDGKALEYSLVTKVPSDIEYLNVGVLKSDASIRSISIAFKDGNLTTIKVNSMELTSKVSGDLFKPAVVFDSEWIVTDLR